MDSSSVNDVASTHLMKTATCVKFAPNRGLFSVYVQFVSVNGCIKQCIVVDVVRLHLL